MSELGEQIEANLAQMEANLDLVRVGHAAIDAKLKTVESARWRFIRNRRLLREGQEILTRNKDLLASNDRIMGENWRLLYLGSRILYSPEWCHGMVKCVPRNGLSCPR